MPPEIPEENPHKTEGLKRIFKALGYSVEGLTTAIKNEAAFRQELIIASVLIPLAVLLPVDLVSTVLLIAGVMGVLIVELINSALEWTIDYISLEVHPYAKRVKDMGSAAVLLSLFTCGLVWLLVIAANWATIVERLWG